MWLVFKKELKELLRDRKTLFFMIALPLLIFPLIFGGAVYVSSKAVQEAQSKVLKYAVVGGEYAPSIQAELEKTEEFERVEVDLSKEYKVLIDSEQVDFILEIPDNYSEDVLSNGGAVITMYLNDSGMNFVHRRVEEITSSESDRLQQQVFTSLGLTDQQQEGLLKPITLEKENIADDRENLGQALGGIVGYMIFLLCLQGAMAPAADIGAGEKERGTLETLLISPIERHHLVLGKFLTVCFAGMVTALLVVGSMAMWGVIASQGMAIEKVMDFMSAIGAIDFVLMFLMLIPVVAIFGAILLSLSIYAKSFKEAQSYMGSLIVIVIVPSILPMLPGIELKGVWAWVPLTNVSLAIKELIKGTMDYYQLFAIFGSTAIIAGLLIGFCIHWFNKEKVLFR